MRKYIMLVCLFALGLFASAQSEFDALRYSQSDIIGTARYVSMSGAFGALGGDMSAINVNPAGIGVYRSSEFSLSPGFELDATKTNLDGTKATANKTNLLMNGFGYVGSFRTYDESAISNFNFGISYNRLADFNRNTRVKGTGRTTSLIKETSFMENWLLADGSPNTTSFWDFMNMSNSGIKVLDETNTGYFSKVADNELSNSDMLMEESGGINSWNFTLGANYNHTLYVGLGIGIQSVKYDKYSSYIEDFTADKGIELRNVLTTTGSGYNFSAGVIYRPVPELRVGLSYKSGTYYMLTDVFSASMASWGFTNPITGLPYTSNQTHEGGEHYVDYMLKTPGLWTLSAAYQFGKRGLFSFDMDYKDNSSIVVKDNLGYELDYINVKIKDHFAGSLNFRVGGELRLTDNFSARLGAAYYLTPIASNLGDKYIYTSYTRVDYSIPVSTSFASAGLGYPSGAFFTDIAVQEKWTNEHFFNYYDDISIAASEPTYANLTSNRFNMVLTTGFKF